jgi:hypothetical protein
VRRFSEKAEKPMNEEVPKIVLCGTGPERQPSLLKSTNWQRSYRWVFWNNLINGFSVSRRPKKVLLSTCRAVPLLDQAMRIGASFAAR